jgi:hypothetical protein
MQPIPTGALVGAGSLDLLKKYSLSHGQNGQLREWFGVQKIQTPILHKSKQGRLKNTWCSKKIKVHFLSNSVGSGHPNKKFIELTQSSILEKFNRVRTKKLVFQTHPPENNKSSIISNRYCSWFQSMKHDFVWTWHKTGRVMTGWATCLPSL